MLQSLAKFLYLFKDEDPHQNPGSLPSTHFATWPLTWMSIFYIYKIAETISIPSTFIKQINACKITLSKVVIYVKEVKDIICLEHHNYFDIIFTNGWETNKYIILDVILRGNLFYSWFLYSVTFFCILKTQWQSRKGRELSQFFWVYKIFRKLLSHSTMWWRSWNVPGSLNLNIDEYQRLGYTVWVTRSRNFQLSSLIPFGR